MIENDRGIISVATTVGNRELQEDYFIAQHCGKGLLLAVMDGHVGPWTAKFIHENFVRYFMSGWRRFLNSEKALRYALGLVGRFTRKNEAGSTMSVAFVHGGKNLAHIAVIGDSPVVVFTKDGPWIAPEHNVRINLPERERCIARGGSYDGHYIRSNKIREAGLQLSRSFGDAEMGDVIERVPEYFTLELGAGGYVALMTDGVLNPIHTDVDDTKRVADIIHEGAEASDLVRKAPEYPKNPGLKYDNVTAIVWRPLV